jgi:chloride channel protein, CIC family
MTDFETKKYFRPSNFILPALVVLTGILGGFGAVVFRTLIDLFHRLIYFQEGDFTEIASFIAGWRIVLGPAIGGAVVGPLIYFFAREAKGSGVPEVIYAADFGGGILRKRILLVKAVASALCIGSGGSAGREGPVIQMGSAIGSVLGQSLGLPAEQLRVLVGCGAAAGIGATFNAPIAGAIFALEIVLLDITLSTAAPVLLSSVLGTVVARTILGDSAPFQIPPYSWQSVLELPSYILLGGGAGVVAVAFTISLYRMEDLWNSLKIPEYWKASIGGIVVGCLGLYFPQVMGLGYPTIEKILLGQEVWSLLLILLPLKILATSVTLGSGGSGGILAPSFFMGAALGGLFGFGVNAVFPQFAAPAGAYAVVGMCAVVAGTTLAPLQALVMVLEMTKNYQMILPLALCCAISTFIAYRIKKQSIYTLKLFRRGIDIEAIRNLCARNEVKVKDYTP